MLNINKKSALAVALVAGLGMTSTASAFTLLTAGNATPVFVATADIVTAATPIGVDETFDISLVGSDLILGRTTGFTIRINLNNGATFDATLGTADLTIGAANNSWTAFVLAGGGDGDNFLVIKVDPNATPVGLNTGALLTINGATSVVSPTPDSGLVLDSLTALQTAGQQVVASVQFADPVTAALIMPAQTLPILQSGDPVVLACDAADGDTAKTIDVGVNGTQAAKTYFSSTGAIGLLDSGYINLGSITVSIDPDFTSFQYLFNDEFVTTVNGDFSAFSTAAAGYDVFLSSSSTCATNEVNGVISNANGTVTFTYLISDLTSGNPAGSLAYICANVPAGNTVVIDASTVTVTNVFTRGAATSSLASCDLLPLRYNGSVVDVYHINPAGNTTAQSFVRVINPSDTSGTVTITGIDDNGADALAPITFVLGARKSMQINSEDLENGNVLKGLTGAWGNGAGKWRATVTGEFPDMLVQGLNRNSTDGTVTNLTDADNNGEQKHNDSFN